MGVQSENEAEGVNETFVNMSSARPRLYVFS